jgi:hypothetical protein
MGYGGISRGKGCTRSEFAKENGSVTYDALKDLRGIKCRRDSSSGIPDS